MPNMMEVTWVRPGHEAGGAEPYEVWRVLDKFTKLFFVVDWAADPRGHFAKFSSVPTQDMLQMLVEMAEYRTMFAAFGTDWANYRSVEIDMGLLNDTLDVVKHSPFHCGAWLGLLTIRPMASKAGALVDRPSPDGPLSHVVLPPALGSGLLEILSWLMQSIQMRPENYDIGDRWIANESMLQFLRGQVSTGGPLRRGRATRGCESISSTLLGLVYEGADRQLLHFYLRHLRGHGPEEIGKVHLMNEIVSTHDADRVTMKQNLVVAMDGVLRGFPGAWAQSAPSNWNHQVVEHIREWLLGMGNHPTGLTWLRDAVQERIDEWRAPAIMDEIRGMRTIQRTVGTTVTDTVTESVSHVEAVRTSIGLAYRSQLSATWQRSLEDSLTHLNSISTTDGHGIENTTGVSGGTETSATVGGETGEAEKLVVGKITGETTATIKTSLSSQFRTHLDHERNEVHSTQDGTRTVTSLALTAMRERSFNMSQEASESLTRTVQRGRTLAQSVEDVIRVDGDLAQQTSLVLRGLEISKTTIESAMGR